MAERVLIYTTPTCPYCRQAKEYLKGLHIPFEEKNVAADPIAAQEMIQRSGQRGVPVLIIDGELIVGFDRRRIDQALAKMQSGRPKLGASVADASLMAAKLGLGIQQGAYVGRVGPGSVAERAGIQSGDVILELAGQPIASANDVQRVMDMVTSGQRVTVIVWRNGRRLPLEVTF